MHPLPVLVHREPQALEGGLSEKDHDKAALLAHFGRECSGRLPEPVPVRMLGLQTAPLGVSEGVLKAAGRSYSGCFRILEMSPASQFMTWDMEDKAIAVNALVCQWDQVTWLFPPVPLIPEVLQIVEEQQIEAVLICPDWKGTSWWPQLSELRKQVLIRLPPVARCCQYPRGSAQSLTKLDPLIAVHISARPST